LAKHNEIDIFTTIKEFSLKESHLPLGKLTALTDPERIQGCSVELIAEDLLVFSNGCRSGSYTFEDSFKGSSWIRYPVKHFFHVFINIIMKLWLSSHPIGS